MPPITVEPGHLRVAQAAGSRAIGNEYGSASMSSVPLVGSSSGQPEIATPSAVCIASERDRRRPGPPRSAPRSTDRPGPFSTSIAAARDPDRRGSRRSTSGSSSLRRPAGDVFERADVVRRGEANDEVGPFAVELLDDLARDLAHRLERQWDAARARPRSGSRDPCLRGFGADTGPGLSAISAQEAAGP